MFSFTWLTHTSLRHLSIVLMRHFILMSLGKERHSLERLHPFIALNEQA
jgi:hypothetical protein